MRRGVRFASRLALAFALVSAALGALFLARPAPGQAATGPVLFGIDEGYQAPDLFRQSGATWDRINFHWEDFQPNGPDDWVVSIPDSAIASDLASGMKIAGVITNPPAWATRNGSVPVNLDLPVTDPQNYWAAFTRRLARAYAGRIDDWIIWNEPDIDPGQPGSTWAGTEDEFYLLVKDASLAMKAANPRARIIFAGTTYWTDILHQRKLFVERVLDAGTRLDPTAPANGYYFDAVDIHIYSSPYQIATIVPAYRAALARYHQDKPIWVSEMNVVPWNDPASDVPRGGYRATLDEQAAYMIQAVALARVAGVERAAVYKMIDGTILKGEPFGLIRNDGTPRPAYRAFQVAMQYLTGPGTVTYQSQGDARLVTITNGQHRVLVAWSATPNSIDLPITPQGTTALLVTKLGETTRLDLPRDPSQPNYVLHLTGATANTDDSDPYNYIIGGDPLILVEDGIGQGVEVAPGTIYYPITGFAISGPVLDYFEHRGGLRTFGYPISRPFLFLGKQVQFFQRRVVEIHPDGTIGQLNLLDPQYMPYTRINNATFPPPDLELARQVPPPNSPDYTRKVMDYVNSMTPDEWQGMRVNFRSTFAHAVSLSEAFPTGTPHPELLPGINLELWGVPTSRPALDPNNHNFVYQRFQRGIMHYDRTTGVTQGLLLADYFKAIITGRGLPPDLEAEAQSSRFYRQYDPSQPGWVARPDQLPNTNLSFAFERQAAPTPPPTPTPTPAPVATGAVGAGGLPGSAAAGVPEATPGAGKGTPLSTAIAGILSPTPTLSPSAGPAPPVHSVPPP